MTANIKARIYWC